MCKYAIGGLDREKVRSESVRGRSGQSRGSNSKKGKSGGRQCENEVKREGVKMINVKAKSLRVITVRAKGRQREKRYLDLRSLEREKVRAEGVRVINSQIGWRQREKNKGAESVKGKTKLEGGGQGKKVKAE